MALTDCATLQAKNEGWRGYTLVLQPLGAGRPRSLQRTAVV